MTHEVRQFSHFTRHTAHASRDSSRDLVVGLGGLKGKVRGTALRTTWSCVHEPGAASPARSRSRRGRPRQSLCLKLGLILFMAINSQGHTVSLYNTVYGRLPVT